MTTLVVHREGMDSVEVKVKVKGKVEDWQSKMAADLAAIATVPPDEAWRGCHALGFFASDDAVLVDDATSRTFVRGDDLRVVSLTDVPANHWLGAQEVVRWLAVHRVGLLYGIPHVGGRACGLPAAKESGGASLSEHPDHRVKRIGSLLNAGMTAFAVTHRRAWKGRVVAKAPARPRVPTVLLGFPAGTAAKVLRACTLERVSAEFKSAFVAHITATNPHASAWADETVAKRWEVRLPRLLGADFFHKMAIPWAGRQGMIVGEEIYFPLWLTATAVGLSTGNSLWEFTELSQFWDDQVEGYILPPGGMSNWNAFRGTLDGVTYDITPSSPCFVEMSCWAGHGPAPRPVVPVVKAPAALVRKPQAVTTSAAPVAVKYLAEARALAMTCLKAANPKMAVLTLIGVLGKNADTKKFLAGTEVRAAAMVAIRSEADAKKFIASFRL